MKLIFKPLVLFALAFAAASAAATEIQVVISGKYFGTVDAYRVGTTYYLGAKDAADIFGGQLQWFAVTQRVQLSIHGKSARFFIDSDQASIGSEQIKLSHAVIMRTTKAFIPLDFFLSSAFADLAGVDSQFSPRTGLLTVDRRVTVGPLRWFSYGDYTRIVLNINKSLTYSASRQGRTGLEVSIPFGKIDWPEVVSVGDGLVKTIQIRQGTRSIHLYVKFDGQGRVWQKTEYPNPRRLVVDVYKSLEAMKASPAQPLKPIPATLPPVSAKAGVPNAGVEVPAAIASSEISSSSSSQNVVPGTPEAISSTTAISPTPAVVLVAASSTTSAKAQGGTSPATSKRKYRVVVDAGHGGKDQGATGRHGSLEKDINLWAAKELANLLKEEDAFDVMLIRNDDTFVPLNERSHQANSFEADLFISMHCNANYHRGENGFEIYSLSERASDPESQRVADMENAAMQLEEKPAEDEDSAKAAPVLRSLAREEFLNYGHLLAGFIDQDVSRRVDLANRGVKEAAFYVLRGTDAPAVLVEMGFLTNSTDEAKLESKRYRRRLIEGIYAGILNYAGHQGWGMTARKYK